MRRVTYAAMLVFAFTLLLPTGLLAVSPEDAERETALKEEVRTSSGEEQAMALRELAFLRERMDRIPEAIDTWGHLKKTHGSETAFSDSSAPPQTYARQADFHMIRLRRVQNLRANPPSAPSRDLRKKLSWEQNVIRGSLPRGNAGYDLITAPVDMDGDLIPEVFTVVGQREELGKRADMMLFVHKWDGKQYKEAFRWSSPDFQLGWPDQPQFDIHDYRGHGMYEISVGFEPETDNVATLVSNGREILWQ